ncbi:hypothetical protein DM02DRAFT_507128, partial [Periconia macrospinosa]
MAHQAHAIPWQTLADNLKFTPASARYLGITNLYPRSKPGQAKQLQHFARVFARVLCEYAAIERKKYAAEYTPPRDDEVIISDTSFRNIENVVKEYMKEVVERFPELENDLLPQRERTIKPWIAASRWNSCHPADSLLETDELLRTLVLRGEMDTLFRIASHPQVRLDILWLEGRKFAFDVGGYGLCELKESALLAYICLNVFYLKPELYDPTMRSRMLNAKSQRKNQTPLPPDTYDYRLTAAYQQTLVSCTGTGYPYAHYGAHKIPHREFFGVPYGTYTSQPHWYTLTPYTIPPSPFGKSTLRDLVDKNFPYKYIPSKADVRLVISLLRTRGLPTELALQILDLAAYVPRGRLRIREDPLHAENADELKKYLGYCWIILVRIDML